MFCVLIAHTTVVCIIWNTRVVGIDMHLNTTSITLFYIGLFIYYPYKLTLLVTESDTIIDVHTIRLDCELNIMDSTSYCFISIQCWIWLITIIFEMKIVNLVKHYIIKIITILIHDENIRAQKFRYGNITWMIKWESHQGS